MKFLKEKTCNQKENNIDIQTGLILHDDGRHKAVQSIIVIR